MTHPQPDDDRIVELDDGPAIEPAPDDWDARTGTATDDDRLLLDEMPPHWG